MSRVTPLKGTASAESSPPARPPAKALLVVDDNADMRLLVRLLVERDHRLKVLRNVDSANAALDALDTIAPDLVILDNSLGGPTTGLRLAPTIKARAPGTRILLFSAFDLRHEVAKEPAIDAFLRKHRFTELAATVQRLLDLDAV